MPIIMTGKKIPITLAICITPLLTALCLFILLEISLRIYNTFDPSFPIVPDTTYLKYRGKPYTEEFNGFKLNSRGYKDTEFCNNKSPGRFRILALGDSQTYGAVPYPDCYMTLVENGLRSAHPDCEILNMGVPSTGPVDYLSILLNEGLDLHPDMVLLNFNIYDDFKNGGKRFKLYSYSAAASFINRIIINRFKPRGQVFGAGLYREGITLRGGRAYLQIVIDAHGGVFRKKNALFAGNFRSSFSYVERIKRICDIKNIALAVVIIPADLQLYPFLQTAVIKQHHAGQEEYDFRIPNRMLARECDRLHIPYIDILDAFLLRCNSDGKILTQENDPHWNRHGSAVAAAVVSPWLIRQVGRQKHSNRIKTDNLPSGELNGRLRLPIQSSRRR
jgi:hypothetical protein